MYGEILEIVILYRMQWYLVYDTILAVGFPFVLKANWFLQQLYVHLGSNWQILLHTYPKSKHSGFLSPSPSGIINKQQKTLKTKGKAGEQGVTHHGH